jgi:hypothetical protein
MPEMAEIHVPAVARLLDRHLEGAAAPAEVAVADRRHVARLPAWRDRIGAGMRCKSQRADDQRRLYHATATTLRA